MLHDVEQGKNVGLASLAQRLRVGVPADDLVGGVPVRDRGQQVPARITEAGQNGEVGVRVQVAALQHDAAGCHRFAVDVRGGVVSGVLGGDLG